MGFFSGAKAIVVATATASKNTVFFIYDTAQAIALPVFVYVAAFDLHALAKSAYKSGLSVRTRQQLMYLALNLATTYGLNTHSNTQVLDGRVDPYTYAPVGVGLIIKNFSHRQRRKEKLDLVLKQNDLLKEVIIETAVFDPLVLLARRSTDLISRDPIEQAYAEQVKLFQTLERMRLWQEGWAKKPEYTPNQELPVTEHQLENNADLLGEGLASLDEKN